MARTLATVEQIQQAIKAIREFEQGTGQRLNGAAGDLAEHMAAHELGLTLSQASQGPDAFKGEVRYEIKSRYVGSLSVPGNTTAMRVPTHQEWDVYVVVELDDDYGIVSLWSARREALEPKFYDEVKQKDGSTKRKPYKTVQKSRIIPHATFHDVHIFVREKARWAPSVV